MDLQGTFSTALLAEAFAKHGGFPFPPPAWARSGPRLDSHVAGARSRLGTPWPSLVLNDYLRYYRDGNRSEFEKIYFNRRRRLGSAAIAQAAGGEQAFAAEAADGLWLICEESSWCLPAHARHGLAADVPSCLPPTGSGGYIDLFNCETAMVLAETCQLIGPALDGIDCRIVPRVREEIRRRILDPLLAGVHPGWPDGHNNWSVWCASSSIIAAGFALAGEPQTWARLVHRMLGVVDRYVNRQGADGGCDEGVMYWGVAGGCVIRALEEVRARTGGLVDGWSLDPRIAEIMRYPARMHLGNGTFPAFADGHHRVNLPSGILAIAAERTASPELHALAAQLADPVRDGTVDIPGVGDLLVNQLRALTWYDGRPIPADAGLVDTWLPNLQVLVAHGAGTSLAAKGGHNAENHNHNDVGQFVVHRHGVPLVVDAGRGDYTAQTFGPKRYELWWPRASGHAVPQIDGHEQQTGWERQARAVSCTRNASEAALSLDLAACYATEVEVASLQRRVALSRADGTIRLTDTVDAGRTVAYTLPLLTTACPQPDGAHAWIVSMDGQRIRIVADTPLIGCVEEVQLDETMRRSWQRLWRLILSGSLPAGTVAGVSFVPA
jgi:hypothetical protein